MCHFIPLAAFLEVKTSTSKKTECQEVEEDKEIWTFQGVAQQKIEKKRSTTWGAQQMKKDGQCELFCVIFVLLCFTTCFLSHNNNKNEHKKINIWKMLHHKQLPGNHTKRSVILWNFVNVCVSFVEFLVELSHQNDQENQKVCFESFPPNRMFESLALFFEFECLLVQVVCLNTNKNSVKFVVSFLLSCLFVC